MTETSPAGHAAGSAEGRDARSAFTRARREFWSRIAREPGPRSAAAAYYHRRLAEVFRHVVPPGLSVLEVGSGRGDLLAALEPGRGVGIDFSPEMVDLARERHPGLVFLRQDAHELQLSESFDVIVLSDLVNDLWDVQAVLERLRAVSRPDTRIVLNTYRRFWEWPLALAERVGLAEPVLRQNWLTVPDLVNLLSLAGLEPLRSWQEILWPFPVPGVAAFFNRFLVKLWPVRSLALTNVLVARPRPPGPGGPDAAAPSVSIVIPARNEAGNVPAIFARTPELPGGTELIFVEGHSTDDTAAAIERAIGEHPGRRCTLLRQTGRGKGDAVRLGFDAARGDVLMILDADLTVPPEDLPRFYEALRSGAGDLVNGVRLVYPMEGEAMRFLNLLGNHFFARAFSWLLGQPIKDTLCGTKALWRKDYERLARNRAYFGEFDPFGDFDLLFGAARLNLKLVDLPVRYGERTYGTTNIQRFRHGLLLLRMVAFAARRIKFV